MTEYQIARANDHLKEGAVPPTEMDFRPVLGLWHNVHSETGEILTACFREEGGTLEVETVGSGPDGDIPWGVRAVRPYVGHLQTSVVMGLETHYDFGFMESLLAFNYAKGVLVIQSYNRFKDQSGRLNYFTREFFRQ